MKNLKRLTAIVLTLLIFALTLPTVSVFAADSDMRYGRTKLINADQQYVYDALVAGCKDAKAEGFELIEAYPFEHNENHAYHGPLSMYKRFGFELCRQIEGCIVCRKFL